MALRTAFHLPDWGQVPREGSTAGPCHSVTPEDSGGPGARSQVCCSSCVRSGKGARVPSRQTWEEMRWACFWLLGTSLPPSLPPVPTAFTRSLRVQRHANTQ